MSRKKILIAGGGYADIPLVQAAKELGCHVITSGNRPEGLGHLYSDEYQPADFSDPDAMLRLSRRLEIDAICACCNDFSALSCAYVAERMGLPGHDPYETSKLIHHKDRYRSFASAQGIPTPGARVVSDIREASSGIGSLRFPLIVKPVDLTGGKGISVIQSRVDTETALKKALQVSPAHRAVIEEYLAGDRHGFSAFLREGRVAFFFSDNEHYYLNPFLVSAASAPGDVSPAIERKLCQAAEKIASVLSLATGVFHIQYILRGEEPVIIEICRRAPGDLYVKFIEHATGVPYSMWIVRASLGLDCGGLSQVKTRGFFTRHCVMSARAGKVKNVLFDATIEKNVIDRLMWWKVDDTVSDVMTSKFGIAFLKFDSREEMLDKTGRMHELIRVEVR